MGDAMAAGVAYISYGMGKLIILIQTPYQTIPDAIPYTPSENKMYDQLLSSEVLFG